MSDVIRLSVFLPEMDASVGVVHAEAVLYVVAVAVGGENAGCDLALLLACDVIEELLGGDGGNGVGMIFVAGAFLDDADLEGAGSTVAYLTFCLAIVGKLGELVPRRLLLYRPGSYGLRR